MELTKGQLLVIILMQWLIVALFGFGWDKTEKELLATQSALLQEQANLQEAEVRMGLLYDTYVQTANELDEMLLFVNQTIDHSAGDWNYDIGQATAYAPYDNKSGMCNDGDPTRTSTGVAPGPNVIAVDPERIPYGSSVLIFLSNGDCITGIAGDTGAAMRRSEELLVDVFKQTYEEAITFGRQDVLILWR